MASRSRVRTLWSAVAPLAALVVSTALATSRCASGACELNSQCNEGTYCGADHQCHYDCLEERDCEDGFTCNHDRGRCVRLAGDAGPIEEDAAKKTGDTGEAPDVGAPVDAGFPVDLGRDVPVVPDVPADLGFPVDNPPPIDVPPVVDVPPVMDNPPVVDTGPAAGTRGFFDPCTSNADCLSGECLTTTGGARFCTRRCASTSDCADGFVCNSPPAGEAARCVPDDTGTPCTVGTAIPCARFCVGNPENPAVAHCTRECLRGADCPAGYACQLADATHRVCMSVEQPCARGLDCVTNLCVGMAGGFQGCTSRCLSDSDCPRRMTINATGIGVVTLPPYRCQVVGGERICAPPILATGGDIVGSNEIGASCGSSTDPACRSGVCDGEVNVCVQGCTPSGGCPSGFVCRPWVDDGDIYLVCRRSVVGVVPIGGSCAMGADCVTGLCQGTSPSPTSPGYCTRFCNDRLCPSGMTCRPLGSSLDGTMISLCQPT